MINLLPDDIKERQRIKSKLYGITVVYIVIAALFVLGPVAFATYNLVQGSQINEYLARISQIQAQIGQSKDINDKLALIENRLDQSKQFQESRDWSEYLTTITDSIPSDVVASTITLEDGTAATPSFSVGGSSNDRRSVILFRDRLLQEESVTEANFDSISEIVTEEDKTFTFVIRIIFSQ